MTVQGGIGTYSEDRFLFEHYGVDGTGWATPFLLVPEVTNLDYPTRLQLAATSRDDLYLSGISPLGVPFNTFLGSQSEQQKLARIAEGNPGSPCPKMYLVSNTEFTSKPICTASAVYQKKKIEQLKSLMLAPDVYQAEFQKVVDKACLCEDLAAGALINCNLENGRPLKSAVCPGPNLAYFSRIMTLSEMVGHIYGRWSVLNGAYRPNMFIAELKMYIDYLQNEILKVLPTPTEKQVKYLLEFKSNLVDGIVYYKGLIPQLVRETKNYQETMAEELNGLFNELETLMNKYRPELAGELPSVAAGAK
ncbi:hypothetical protein EBR96_07560 [bacterium]|nr:hypothetical protein [bacterium]